MADSLVHAKKYAIKGAPSTPKEPTTLGELFAQVKEVRAHIFDKKRKGSELYRRLESIEARLNALEEKLNG